MTLADRFSRLSTAAKLLLILSAVLLPIGIILTWVGETGIRQANAALHGRSEDQSRSVAAAIESLIARDALALRIAANGALAYGVQGACDRGTRSLSIAPGVAQSFELETIDGKPICSVGNVGDTGAMPLTAPGDIQLRVAPGGAGVAVRAGVANGMATAIVPVDELRNSVADSGDAVRLVGLHDADRELPLIAPSDPNLNVQLNEWPLGHGNLLARIGVPDRQIRTTDRLVLLLPVLMWIAAALITWLLVSRLLIRPRKRLERGVTGYQPGQSELDLPRSLGPSEEIQELRDAFARAVARVEESDREMSGALEGQRRLVREVHHRVKNNLQVVAS